MHTCKVSSEKREQKVIVEYEYWTTAEVAGWRRMNDQGVGAVSGPLTMEVERRS